MSGKACRGAGGTNFCFYARIRAAMVRRQRRVAAIMVEHQNMRGHIKAAAASVNA
jgi:hypothetical protein